MRLKNFLIVAAMTAGLLGAVRANAQTVLSDNFESYADVDALRAAWTGSTATAFNLNAGVFDPVPTPLATQTGLSNLGRFTSTQLAYRALSAPIASTSNFKAQVDVLSETYARAAGFAITNAAGTQGYVVRWDNSAVGSNSGRGLVSILEYNSGTAIAAGQYGTAFTASRPVYATDGGTGLPTGQPTSFSSGTSTNSYHPGVGYRVVTAGADANSSTYDSVFRGLLTLTFEYTAPTTEGGAATLKLFTSGSDNPNPLTIPVLNASDASPFLNFNFERFYVLGTAADFDNVLVQVPEPASLGLLTLGGWFLARRRRVAH